MTLIITTFSIMTLSLTTLNIMGLFATLSMNDKLHYYTQHDGRECRYVMLSVIMESVKCLGADNALSALRLIVRCIFASKIN